MPVDYRGTTGITAVLYPLSGKVPDASLASYELDGEHLFRTGHFAVTTPHGVDTFVLNPERLAGVKFDGERMRTRARIKLARSSTEIVVR